jgi:alpha-glucosidase
MMHFAARSALTTLGLAVAVVPALAVALALAACGDDSASSSNGTSGTGSGGGAAFAEKDWDAEAQTLLSGPDWYRHAVFYEVYVRSLQDGDGDGIGDLAGLTSRLDDIKAIGVDAIWLMPIMPTPFVDSGYDVADYVDVNPDYGTLEDFDALIAAAHERGMRVIIDLVLNHTSNEHDWFQESRQDETNPKADWYVWSDTEGRDDIGCGTQNPTFGESAWEFDEARGQYYFHRFYAGQPDLNYRNPEVQEATLDVARFWLDRGVDGFRCDVVGLLVESADDCGILEETKAYIRDLRDVVESYDGSRVLVAEPSDLTNATAYFGDGTDMMHMAFDFGFGYFWGLYFNTKSSDSIVSTFDTALTQYPEGAQDALVIGSHDVPRAFSTALTDETRHRRAALIQMTMKGTPFIYYGEEIGMRPGSEEVVDFRDKARTPMPWTPAAGHGFTDGTPWIPFGDEVATINRETEESNPESMLAYYRTLLELRRGRAVWGAGAATIATADTPRIFAFTREDDFMRYVVAVNMIDDETTAHVAIADVGKGAQLVVGEGTIAPTSGDGTAEVVLPPSGAAIWRTR